MKTRDALCEWELLNRVAAWTGSCIALSIAATTACMLVAFATSHPGWGLAAAAAIVVELGLGSAVVGGVTLYDRHTHHGTAHLR